MSRQRHPRELPYLFLTEMWERFSFYLMLGLMTLYMITDPGEGGLGLDEKSAGTIFGSYIAFVYLTPFIGGLVADRLLGYRKSIVLGGVLMCLGHIALAFEPLPFFYFGLILLIAGNGFFKPNISTLLGRVYEDKPELKDAGFNIFYLGINLGGLICNFVAAIVRNHWGWHAAFASAGIGMAIGLVTFLFAYKRLGAFEIDIRENRGTGQKDEGLGVLLKAVLPAAIGLGLGGYALGGMKLAFFLACVPVIGFYGWIWFKASAKDRKPIQALYAISVLLIPFWMVFNLYGTVMTFWAESNTDRTVSSEVAVDLLETVNLLQDAPPSYFHNADTALPRPAESSLYVVTGTDEEIAAIKSAYAVADDEDAPIPLTQEEFDAVYQNAGPDRLAEGDTIDLINTELFQSLNPFWVILLTPFVVGFWGFLRRRNREPSTPAKMGVGMLFGAAYMLVMLAAVHVSGDGAMKLSAMWMVGAYAVVTIGELWLSPIGLSLVSKVAPSHLGAVMMGGFFLTIAIGNKLSGMIGGMWGTSDHSIFFIVLAVILVVFAGIVFLMTPWLKRYTK